MDVTGRSGEMAVFASVAEHGSLSGAARDLGLTPSAVSRIVALVPSSLTMGTSFWTRPVALVTPETVSILSTIPSGARTT